MAATQLRTTTAIRSYRVYLRDASNVLAKPYDVAEVIGGDGIGSGRTSRTMTRRDEKCVLSLAMARTSSYRVGR